MYPFVTPLPFDWVSSLSLPLRLPCVSWFPLEMMRISLPAMPLLGPLSTTSDCVIRERLQCLFHQNLPVEPVQRLFHWHLPIRFPCCRLLRVVRLFFQRSTIVIPTLPIVPPESVVHSAIGSPVCQAIQRPLIHLSTVFCAVGVVCVRGYSGEHIDAGIRSAVIAAGVPEVLEQS